ncbi:MAG TPA: hypothetical protein VKH82_04150 [Candidatus Binatia bacterium]|nr:hypothetical protein [Candidatus Binatia bacterium]
MSKRWLNHYLVTSGTWADGQSDLVDTFMSIEFTPPTDVVFHETAHSGHVLLTRSGETSSSHGHGGGGKSTVHTGPTTIVIADTQIYLNIVSGDERTLPLRTARRFRRALERQDDRAAHRLLRRPSGVEEV